jgi:hypothetical protein
MYFNDLVEAFDRSRVERNAFHDLMRYHVREVLLVASLYESFVVESDGVLTEQIYGEYYMLHLDSVPRITCAYTADSALGLFREGRFDLVVLISGLDFEQPLGLARAMKDESPGTPVLLMATNNTSLAALAPDRPGLEAIDRVFVWNGYSKLFLGMLKQVEDLRNVDSDTRTGLVRVILLIEDSVRYYSRYLPLLFQVVQRQAQALIEAEKGVETHKLLRARSRPKILLASSFEEACAFFERYEPYILTVITDVRFPRGGEPDPEAGFDFIRMAKARIPDLPVMIQSSEERVRARALALGASFADKNSESLERELESFFRDSLGFGPFLFRMPDGAPVSEARDIDEFMGLLEEVPEECLVSHAGRNDFSTWLAARGELRFAERLKPYGIGDFGTTAAMRDFILGVLREARAERARGVIPYYDSASCRDENSLSRLGDGSVGGKGRGLIFIKSLLDNVSFPRYLRGLDVKIPRTAFIGIDEFELFLEANGMWSYAFYESAGPRDGGAGKDEELRARFLATKLSDGLEERLERLAADADRPLAVRSSGLFEDMLQLPFSGIYETYIIPNSHPDRTVRGRQLALAVKLIYASLFSRRTRAYFDMAGYALEEERMGVIVQELAGSRRGDWFYPDVSGTAQSHNYYPVSPLKPDDGLCVAAVGLGTYVVGGGPGYRLCPKYPELEVTPPERLRGASQRSFRALYAADPEPDLLSGEEAALRELDIGEAAAGTRGRRIVDPADLLAREDLPFAQAVDMILDIGSRSMGTPVEIEYALNADEPSGTPALYLLQLKPLIRNEGRAAVDLEGIDRAECFVFSDRSMGNGRDATVSDIVWVDPRRFERSETAAIAAEIEELDGEMRSLGRRYVLVGPGRWGSRDRRLGVPVAITQISMARVIVEADLPEFEAEPSLGSNFFHNVTSMNVGYITASRVGSVDWDWLYSEAPARETAHCRRTRLPEALEILMDGRRGVAAIRKRSPFSARLYE